MSDVVLRPAKPADAAGITACVGEAFVHYIERIGKQPGPMRKDFADVVKQFQVHVAVAASKIVGAIVPVAGFSPATADEDLQGVLQSDEKRQRTENGPWPSSDRPRYDDDRGA